MWSRISPGILSLSNAPPPPMQVVFVYPLFVFDQGMFYAGIALVLFFTSKLFPETFWRSRYILCTILLLIMPILLLSVRCWLLLPLWDSVIVLCFVVRYFVSILALQTSRWGRESWLLCFVLVIVVWLFLTIPRVYLQFVIVVFPDHTHDFRMNYLWPISPLFTILFNSYNIVYMCIDHSIPLTYFIIVLESLHLYNYKIKMHCIFILVTYNAHSNVRMACLCQFNIEIDIYVILNTLQNFGSMFINPVRACTSFPTIFILIGCVLVY